MSSPRGQHIHGSDLNTVDLKVFEEVA